MKTGETYNPEIHQRELEKQDPTEKMKTTVIEALKASFDMWDSLGASGQESVEKNQFGDTALHGDIKAEQAILDYLKLHNIPIRVVSEEHGVTNIGDDPQYLGVLDGLDGSSLYKEKREEGKYGTMFAIFSGTNPTYNDYVAGGIMQHATGKLFVASKNGGAFVVTKEGTSPIHATDQKTLDQDIKIYIDEHWETNRKAFSDKLEGFNTECLGASCAYYAAVSEGEAGYALECTRKGNLELAVSYGIIKEAGGVMVDTEGNDLGDKPYLTFAQDKEIPVITAGNMDLADDMIRQIK